MRYKVGLTREEKKNEVGRRNNLFSMPKIKEKR